MISPHSPEWSTCRTRQEAWRTALLAWVLAAGCNPNLQSVHAIKTTVSGLAAGGVLELWVNGHDPVTVSTNGEVTLVYMVGGYSYEVTVKTHPSSPAQTCTVTNPKGVMGSADVTGVVVTCRGWGTAQLIENDDRGDARAPHIAVYSSGNAIAVWSQTDGARYSIWANHYIVGSGWGTAQLIETDDRGDAFEPQVAVDSAGDAIAVWKQFDGSLYYAMASRFTAGAGWGAAWSIGTGASGSAPGLKTSMDSVGNAVAVWHQFDFDSKRYSIWANGFIVNSGWGTAKPLGNDSAGGMTGPTVAMDSTGNAMAVWGYWSGTRYDILSSRYTKSEGWGSAQAVESEDGGDAWEPQIAMDSAGNAIAVWSQNDGTSARVFANRYGDSGGWGSAQPIGAGDSCGTQVAMNVAGDAIVVWVRDGSDGGGIWTNSYATPSGWGSGRLAWSIGEFDSVVFGAMNAEGIPVAMDPAGNALVVLTLPHDTGGGVMIGQIWANYYTAGVGWGVSQLIEVDNSNNGDLPQIAMDASGNAIAVWEQSDGTRMNIWANSFR